MSRLQNAIVSLLRRCHGSIGTIFAIAVVPTIAVAGIATDFVYASKMRQSLQQALDAGLLAAVAGGALTQTDLEQVIPYYFTENWNQKYPQMPVQIGYDVQTKSIAASASIEVPAYLTRIIGFDSLPVKVSSTTDFLQDDYEVVLVLDTTSSMNSGGRFTTLKSAATSLVETISDHVTAGTVKFSIVPFSAFVRLPTSYKNSSWLDFVTTGSGKNAILAYTATTPNSWNGCVGYRDSPYDDTDGNLDISIPAFNSSSSCADELLPLTSDISVVTSKISGLTMQGLTYGPAGMLWGIRALSSEEPLTEGSEYGKKNLQKILVFMTDGVNTVQSATSYSTTSSLCTSAKSSGITIFTILFNVNNSTAESTLKSCASTDDDYFDPDDTSELTSVFKEITSKILDIYLSQ